MVVIIAPLTSPPAYRPPPLHEWRGGNRWGYFERPDSLRFAFVVIGLRHRRGASIALASYFFRARPVFSGEVWERGAFERPVFPRSACSVICIAVNCSAACGSAYS